MTKLQQTIEFVETRANKLSGNQNRFTGRLISEQQQERIDRFAQEDEEKQLVTISELEMNERRNYMKSLDKQIRKFNVNKLRDDI